MSEKHHLRNEYISRINHVIDYIEVHIDQELSLKELAKVANFSPYHFHRIFRAITGETLNQCVQRLRLEKATHQLINNPKKTITEIALDCGFSGPTTFARLFKKSFKISASEWRSKATPENSKNGEVNSKNGKAKRKDGKDFTRTPDYSLDVTWQVSPETNNQIWSMQMKNNQPIQVEVKDMPEIHVAYLRYVGPYEQMDEERFGSYLEELFKWAAARDIKTCETQVLGVFHDVETITDADKQRTSVCITVPENTPVDGKVGKMTIPAGKYAFARFQITADQFEDAWDLVMREWLPESGYQPADSFMYDLWHNDPRTHPDKLHILDICLPIKPL